MVYTPADDYTTMIAALALIAFIDLMAFKMGSNEGGNVLGYIIAMTLGMFMVGSIFSNDYVITDYAYSAAWQTNKVDPNIWAVIFVVATAFSAYLIYWDSG